MRMIVIEEAKLDALLKQALDRLKLVHLEGSDDHERAKRSDLHRRFHYEVCALLDEIRKG